MQRDLQYLGTYLDQSILEKLKKINCGWCKGVNTAGTGFLLKTHDNNKRFNPK